MDNLFSYTPLASLLAGIWAIVNGILHDTFILQQGRKYDRDLLRLLMDGHILITCGIIQALAYKGMKTGYPMAIYFSLAATISLLIYCGMIWPFLKPIGTIGLNAILLVFLMVCLLQR